MKTDDILRDMEKNKEALCSSIKKESYLDDYVDIQRLYLTINISSHEHFQKLFKRFYKLRLPRSDNYNKFFEYFENIKRENNSFENILSDLQKITGRIEASFASKILHTANTEMPIIDGEVLRFLDWSLPKNQEIDRKQKTISTHKRLQNIFSICLENEQWGEISSYFSSIIVYRDFSFSEAKKLDTLMWKYRSTIN